MTAWLAVAGFAVLAAACLVWATRRRAAGSEAPPPEAVFAAGQRDLQADAKAQGLPAATVAALEEELALDVLDTTPAPAAASGRAGTPGLLPLLGGALALAALALALYGVWGEPRATLLADSAQLLAAEADPPQLVELIDALAARTRRQPKDGDAWFHLGHARMRQEDFDGAAEAFAALHTLTGANEQVDLAWVQARYLAADGVIDPATQAIIDRVLAVRPNQPALLELLAMDALRGRDFAGGARLLARALRQPLPAGRRALLAETLALARQRLDPSRPLVEVAVTAPPDSPPWLMVFARPTGGGPPLAVARQPTQPTQTIILDAANAMTEDAQLFATAQQVEVVARLSAGGTASESLAEAISAPVSPASQPAVRLVLRLEAADGGPTTGAVDSTR